MKFWFKKNKTVAMSWLLIFLLPTLTFAALGDPLVPGSCRAADPKACTLCDLLVLAGNIYVWILGISLLLAIGLITFAGVQMIVNSANPKKQGEGRDLIFQTLIALAIVFGSYLIVSQVIKALGATKTDFFTFRCTGSAGNIGGSETPGSVGLSGTGTSGGGGGGTGGGTTTIPANATEAGKKVLEIAKKYNGQLLIDGHKIGGPGGNCTTSIAEIYRLAGITREAYDGEGKYGTGAKFTPSPGDEMNINTKDGPGTHAVVFDHSETQSYNGKQIEVWYFYSATPQRNIPWRYSDRPYRYPNNDPRVPYSPTLEGYPPARWHAIPKK